MRSSEWLTQGESTIITTIGRNEIQMIVLQYIVDHYLVDPDGLTPDLDLFREGIIDSFGFVELVTFLETQFKVKFDNEDLVSDNLNTISNIVKTVAGKANAT